jgi:hypothetical protein
MMLRMFGWWLVSGELPMPVENEIAAAAFKLRPDATSLGAT